MLLDILFWKAEPNFTTKILIPSQKRRKIIDKDTTITAQYVDNIVITEGYPNPTNLDETIVDTLSISEPIFYNLDHSDDTTLDTKPKLDYDCINSTWSLYN